jgi:hypothetical protein
MTSLSTSDKNWHDVQDSRGKNYFGIIAKCMSLKKEQESILYHRFFWADKRVPQLAPFTRLMHHRRMSSVKYRQNSRLFLRNPRCRKTLLLHQRVLCVLNKKRKNAIRGGWRGLPRSSLSLQLTSHPTSTSSVSRKNFLYSPLSWTMLLLLIYIHACQQPHYWTILPSCATWFYIWVEIEREERDHPSFEPWFPAVITLSLLKSWGLRIHFRWFHGRGTRFWGTKTMQSILCVTSDEMKEKHGRLITLQR